MLPVGANTAEVIGSAPTARPRLGLAAGCGLLLVVAVALAFEPRLSELGVLGFVERFNVFRLTSALGFGLPGAFLVAVRPRNRISWLLLGIGTAQALSMLGSNYGLVGIHDASRSLPGQGWAIWMSEWMWAPAWSLAPTLVLLVFPTGRLPSPRWRPVAAAAVLTAVLNSVGWALMPPFHNDIEGLHPPGYQNPVPSSLAIADAAVSAGLLLALLTTVASLTALLQRYRSATGAERQQLEWVLVAAVAFVTLLAAGFLLPPPLGPLIVGLAMVPLPLAIAVAVVHHRLWDIDVVLSRSLVFGALTVGVVAIYAITVAVLGGLLGNRTGAPLVATALVAVGIQPAHQRVRRLVNRFVYGDRDDPASALRHLGARIGAASDPGDVLADVAQAIGQRLRLPYVAIEELDSPMAVWGQPVPAVQRVPLSHRGSDVGTLVVGTAADDRLRPADLRALTELAPHVAVVAHAHRLARDLERSHGRLVAARDEERLRLRRELHDGLGPNLAALALEVDRGRRLVGRDAERAKRLLDDLSSRIRHTVGGVRAIVDDLHPPPLDEFGLVGAVEEVAGRFAGELRVTVKAAPGLPPLPAAVELAAYRIAAEAITNAARHAGGSTCQVTFAAGDDLELRVIDNGCGLSSDAAEGVGLPSMRHRAEVLGGSCSVANAPNGGTEVLVRLPLTIPNGHAHS